MYKISLLLSGNNQSTPQPAIRSLSSQVTSATSSPVVSQSTRRKADRPPAWLMQPHEPAGRKRKSAPGPFKSSSALGTQAARQESKSKNAEKPGGIEVGKSRSINRLKNAMSLWCLKGIISHKKSKPDVFADSEKTEVDGTVFTAAQVEEVLEYKRNLASAERQKYLNEFKRWPKRDRKLMTAYIRDGKVEDRLEQAIEKNLGTISATSSIPAKFLRMLSPTERRERKECKSLAKLSRDHWREKLHQEQGEPEVTMNDIIDVMGVPEYQERLFDYAVRTGKADPAVVFQKGLDHLDEIYRIKKRNEVEAKAALQERQKKKAPDPYAISDDSDSDEKGENSRVDAMSIAESSNNSAGPALSFDSAQAEFGSVEERLR